MHLVAHAGAGVEGTKGHASHRSPAQAGTGPGAQFRVGERLRVVPGTASTRQMSEVVLQLGDVRFEQELRRERAG